MPDKPNPTYEFGSEHKAAHALAGTVALPSPFPASARIFIGIKPRLHGAIAERYYVKIVEFISDKHIVTRLVNLEDFRAVRLRPESGRYDKLREWTLKTAEDLQKELEDAKRLLKEAASKTMSAYEILLFPEREGEGDDADSVQAGVVARPERQGVVYVPETAPMLVRTERGVLAAEAAESVGSASIARTCCCMEPQPVDLP